MPGGTASQLKTRRRLPAEVRRAQVLDAALRLVGRGGPRALSIEGIAREAGVSKTVVYNAYGSLDELALAMINREEERALASLVSAAPATDADADPAEVLGAWAEAFADVVTTDPLVWRLMLSPPAGTPQVVLDRIQGGRDLAVAQLRASLESLLDDPDAWDLELAARAIAAAAEELARLVLANPEEFPPERATGFAASILRAVSP